MVFLAPLLLFGLLAALIPIAIHLIRRERPPRVVFGSIRFLKNTPKKLILFQQLQQWVLLFMDFQKDSIIKNQIQKNLIQKN